MRSRCYKETSQAFHHYGGRGIFVCEEWVNDYDKFVADMGFCPLGLSLERKDNALGYNPSNCIWASCTDQQNNKRTNIIVELDGVRRTIGQWATLLGVRYDTLRNRLCRGTSPEVALVSGSLYAGEWEHGTRSGYDHGCRCGIYRDFHNSRMRAQRARRSQT